MKNRLTDLQDQLSKQLERLKNEDLSDDELQEELKRADAIHFAAIETMKAMQQAWDEAMKQVQEASKD